MPQSDNAASHASNVAESQRRAEWESRNRNFLSDDSTQKGEGVVQDAVVGQDARDIARKTAEAAGAYSKVPYSLATQARQGTK
jgi:hypothetical protein